MRKIAKDWSCSSDSSGIALENDSDDNLKKQDLIKKIDEIENYCYNNMPANEKLLENIKSIQLIKEAYTYLMISPLLLRIIAPYIT